MAPKKKLQVKVTLDDLTIGDIETMQDSNWEEMTFSEQINLLDRFVVGDIRKLPATSVEEIMQGIQAAMNTELDSKN